MTVAVVRSGALLALQAPEVLVDVPAMTENELLGQPCGEASAAVGPRVKTACARFGWTARGLQRVMRLARTIADLADSDIVAEPHMAEAIQYRCVIAHA